MRRSTYLHEHIFNWRQYNIWEYADNNNSYKHYKQEGKCTLVDIHDRNMFAYTTDNEQIIFVDTPGIHTPKHALGDFMMKEAEEALMQVDAICYVVEAQDRAEDKDEKK